MAELIFGRPEATARTPTTMPASRCPSGVGFAIHAHRRTEMFLVGVEGEEDDLRVYSLRSEFARHSYPVQFGHIDVEHGDLRTKLPDERDCAFTVGCLANYL